MRSALMVRGLRDLLRADSGSQLARFGVVGAVGVMVNNLLLFLLHGLAGWALIPASVVAVEAAIINNFIWNDRWTFASRRRTRFRFLRFNLVSLGGLAANTAVLAVVVALTGAHYLVANLVAIGVAMAWNFSANSRWTWLRASDAQPAARAGRAKGEIMIDDLVVVPTYNESDNIESLVRGILDAGPFGVLIVDDGSPDGTGEIADGLATDHPGEVAVLHRAEKDGLGSAYRAGFGSALAGGVKRIYQMDADHSHDPAVLAVMRTRLIDGHDLVIGSRYVPEGSVFGWPWWRKVLSRGGSIYAAAILGLRQRDLTGGFKGWRSAALGAIRPHETRSDGYAFQIETTYRARLSGAQVVEIPIRFADRRRGASKMGLPIVFEAIRVVPGLRFDRPAVDPLRERMAGTRRSTGS